MTDFRNPYQRVPFSELVLEKNPRPRESISPESIEDMASSILQHGIIQPLPARMIEGVVKPFIGQRRYFGFQRALERVAAGEQPAIGVDLSVVPVLIEEIDDRTMLERQWVENLQRQNLHPRDETLGYLVMRKELGYTLAQIALKIGKGEAYVSNRLSLDGIPETMWKAFDEGRLTISHLELIGSVPNPLDREEFGKLVLGGKYGDKVMSVKDAQEAKQNRFAVSLRACGFERDDETLVAIEHRDGQRLHGGACTGCEYKQGSEKAPVCVNVRCFKAKQDAVWRRVASNAEDLGKRTMNKDRSSEIFANDGDCELLEASGLVDLGGKLRYQDTGHHSDETPTWESLGLGQGSDAFAAAIVARHPRTNRVHHLLEREDAIRFAIEADPANAKLFANRPGAKKAPKVDPEPEREPENEVVETIDESDDDDHDHERTQAPQTDESSQPVMTDNQAENLGYYVADVGAFYQRAKAGVDIDPLLRMTLEAACGAMTTDAIRVVLAVTGLATIEASADWSRDACVRILMRAEEDIDLLLFTTLITQLRIKGHGPVTTTLQAMVQWPLPEKLEPEPQPVKLEPKVNINRDSAWMLFVEGMGKGAIAKNLDISENTVGNWQKRDWPSRAQLNRFIQAHGAQAIVPEHLTVEAVKAWLAANPA